MYIERERERSIVGYGSSAEPGQQIFRVSLFLRENAARRDVTEITKRARPPLYSQPVTCSCNETRGRFQRDPEKSETFACTYTYIYIYFSTRRIEGGGRRYPRFEYIFFYTMGVRTYDGTDLGYACRVEEKKKYLLDGPRIEFLRRLVLPSEDGKRRGLTNRER